MSAQYEMIGDKAKQTFKKRGKLYTRKGYDIKVESAEKFVHKCQYLNVSQSYVVERLIEAFIWTHGWGPEVKTPPFFEQSPTQHIKQATNSVLKEMWPWSENT